MSKNEVTTVQDNLPTQREGKSQGALLLNMIESVALNPEVDMSKLSALLDMQERVLDREAKMAYDAAMADLQGDLPAVEKIAQGHNSKYAKFEHILSAIKPHMLKHGFSITHRIRVDEGLIYITAVLSHRGGHREETTLPLPPDTSGSKNSVQAIASSTEYGRRYTMNALIGVATKDADKDGGVPADLITDDQVADLEALIEEVKADRKGYLKYLKVTDLSEIHAKNFGNAVKLLENKRGKK